MDKDINYWLNEANENDSIKIYTKNDIEYIAETILQYMQECLSSEDYSSVHGYIEELSDLDGSLFDVSLITIINFSVFHDAIGKIIDYDENTVVISTEY